jgi:hypothetical protein
MCSLIRLSPPFSHHPNAQLPQFQGDADFLSLLLRAGAEQGEHRTVWAGQKQQQRPRPSREVASSTQAAEDGPVLARVERLDEVGGKRLFMFWQILEKISILVKQAMQGRQQKQDKESENVQRGEQGRKIYSN